MLVYTFGPTYLDLDDTQQPQEQSGLDTIAPA